MHPYIAYFTTMSTSITIDQHHTNEALSSSVANGIDTSTALPVHSSSHLHEAESIAFTASNVVSLEQQQHAESNSSNLFILTAENSEITTPPPAYLDTMDVSSLPPPPPYVVIAMSSPTASTTTTADHTAGLTGDSTQKEAALDKVVEEMCFCCYLLEYVNLCCSCFFALIVCIVN